MKHLTILIALAIPAIASAEPTRVGLHLLSVHAARGYEALTFGAYVQSEGGFTFGALRNSERRLSVYAGQTWHTADGQWALTAGAITGYRSARVTPLLIPSVRIPLGEAAAARIGFVPKPRDGGSSALHLSVEF